MHIFEIFLPLSLFLSFYLPIPKHIFLFCHLLPGTHLTMSKRPATPETGHLDLPGAQRKRESSPWNPARVAVGNQTGGTSSMGPPPSTPLPAGYAASPMDMRTPLPTPFGGTSSQAAMMQNLHDSSLSTRAVNAGNAGNHRWMQLTVDPAKRLQLYNARFQSRQQNLSVASSEVGATPILFFP